MNHSNYVRLSDELKCPGGSAYNWAHVGNEFQIPLIF